jgi:hypothetical protein
MIRLCFLNRVNHATSCVIKPATVRGLRSGNSALFSRKNIFLCDYLDEEGMRFSQSRSRRHVLDFNFE